MNTIAIRGAITVNNNTRKDILDSTMELLSNIEKRNNLDKQNVIGIIFSTTKDLDKEYPAVAARNMGYVNTSLMCFNEMYVEGSLNKCIRLMMLYNCDMNQNQINHIYLRKAKALRPDLYNYMNQGGKLMDRNISIAIDGPAGSGKSTISKSISEKLGIEYIDTGAMYRAFTLKILNNNIEFDNVKKIILELENTNIDFKANHIYLDGTIVDKQIRKNIINQNVSYIARIKEVRHGMVSLQRKIANNKSVVMDGRDIGTVILPNADFKFFIIADIDERAKRRYKDLMAEGSTEITLEQVKKELKIRDEIDSTRETAPLIKAKDAIEIDTTDKNIEESVNTILEIIQGR